MDRDEIRMSVFCIVAERSSNEWLSVDQLLAETQKIVGYILDPDITEDEKDVVLDNRRTREQRELGKRLVEIARAPRKLGEIRPRPVLPPHLNQPEYELSEDLTVQRDAILEEQRRWDLAVEQPGPDDEREIPF
jgi:hypothetical protein